VFQIYPTFTSNNHLIPLNLIGIFHFV
jgi:hypothetical protein